MIALDPTRRQEAIEAGWVAYRERVPALETLYRQVCESWEVVALVADGDVIGAVFAKNGELHIGVIAQWRGRWASRRVLKACFQYGTHTDLLGSEVEQLEFVRRAFKIEGIPCRL